jgi:hypothetical protein
LGVGVEGRSLPLYFLPRLTQEGVGGRAATS